MEHGSAAQPRSAPVVDIVRNPADVPPPVGNRPVATVKVDLTAVEVVGKLDPTAGTTYRYWTFNGKVPGPMIRVRQGDSVQVTLHNSPSSRMVHSVDLHAAIGPGGGAALSQVVPGEQKTFTFRATTPGLFVYHCGTPMIADHIANGMYGLILVEPPGGLPRVDHEYYIMQSEIYTTAPKGKAGLQNFSEPNLMKEAPQYFVFNGAVDALAKRYPLKADTGQTVRIFFGDAGPNEASAFHIVGEILTRDYQFGSLSTPLTGVQTASIPPGDAAILELKAVTAGRFNFVDHAISRVAKGLVGSLEVNGAQVAALMHPGPAGTDAPKVIESGILPADRLAISDSLQPPAAADASAASTVSDGNMAGDNGQASAPPVSGSASSNIRSSEPNELKDRSTAQLDGCFLTANGLPALRLFHSSRTYNLEPRPMLFRDSPLAFAGNRNRLVHVTGHFDSKAELYGGDWFVVETIEPLASSCRTNLSLAQLRDAVRRQVEQVGAPTAGAVVVGMGDMSFTSPSVTIRAGQTVVWKNTSAVVHNVVDDAARAVNAADVGLPRGVTPFGSGYLQPGQSYQRTFTVPGTYRYVCTLHETGGMKGIIIVKPGRDTDLASAEAPAAQ